MEAFTIRSRTTFGPGQLLALLNESIQETVFTRSWYTGRTKLMYIAESHTVELATTKELSDLFQYLELDRLEVLEQSLDGFCSVVAPVFIDWTARAIFGSYLHDYQLDPGFGKTGIDPSEICAPTILSEKVVFHALYDEGLDDDGLVDKGLDDGGRLRYLVRAHLDLANGEFTTVVLGKWGWRR